MDRNDTRGYVPWPYSECICGIWCPPWVFRTESIRTPQNGHPHVPPSWAALHGAVAAWFGSIIEPGQKQVRLSENSGGNRRTIVKFSLRGFNLLQPATQMTSGRGCPKRLMAFNWTKGQKTPFDQREKLESFVSWMWFSLCLTTQTSWFGSQVEKPHGSKAINSLLPTNQIIALANIAFYFFCNQ